MDGQYLIAGGFGRERFDEFKPFEYLVKRIYQINRSIQSLLIVSTNLDGFSLTNHRRFTKLPNLSLCQTFPVNNTVPLARKFTLMRLSPSSATKTTCKLS